MTRRVHFQARTLVASARGFASRLALDPASTFIGWAKLDCDEDGPIDIKSGVAKVPEAPPEERVVMVGQIVRGILDRCGCISTAVIEIPDFIAVRAKPRIIQFFRAAGGGVFVVYEPEIRIERVPASDGNDPDPKIARRKQFHDIANRYATADDESDAFCIGWGH